MSFTTLISIESLRQHIDKPSWIIFDCRFSLADPVAGFKAYRKAHIPRARYAHLDNDLSSPISKTSGRHPLPDFNLLTEKLGHWGVTNDSQIIVYDDACGAFAGRMWWLLRCLGHQNIAILDGGIRRWKKENQPLTSAIPEIKPNILRPYLDESLWLNAEQVQQQLSREEIKLIDARTPERFRGEQEPIDPVAGHVPGALNRPFQLNLDNNGLFLPAEQLHEQFMLLSGGIPPEKVVHMCGSGVTACHNLLAMEIAGLTGSRLYAGSWSEWIRDKHRPTSIVN